MKSSRKWYFLPKISFSWWFFRKSKKQYTLNQYLTWRKRPFIAKKYSEWRKYDWIVENVSWIALLCCMKSEREYENEWKIRSVIEVSRKTRKIRIFLKIIDDVWKSIANDEKDKNGGEIAEIVFLMETAWCAKSELGCEIVVCH